MERRRDARHRSRSGCDSECRPRREHSAAVFADLVARLERIVTIWAFGFRHSFLNLVRPTLANDKRRQTKSAGVVFCNYRELRICMVFGLVSSGVKIA